MWQNFVRKIFSISPVFETSIKFIPDLHSWIWVKSDTIFSFEKIIILKKQMYNSGRMFKMYKNENQELKLVLWFCIFPMINNYFAFENDFENLFSCSLVFATDKRIFLIGLSISRTATRFRRSTSWKGSWQVYFSYAENYEETSIYLIKSSAVNKKRILSLLKIVNEERTFSVWVFGILFHN